MAKFSYKAVKPGGESVSGTLDAQSEAGAAGELRRQGLVVVSISKGGGGGRGAAKKGRAKAGSRGGGGGGGGDGGSSFFSLKRDYAAEARAGKVKVKSTDMVVFTRQLSTMISSGIPLVEGIEILSDQADNPGFKASLEHVAQNVRAGKDLSQALSDHPKLFPKIYVNMVRSGEASGQLDVVLSRLAEYQEAAEELKSEIKSAMTYPVVSLILVLGITIFLLVFIIPKFEDMFTSMNVELPAVTKGLLVLSLFLKTHFLLFCAGCTAVGFAVVMYFKTEKGAYLADWILLNMPVFGPLFSKVVIARFSRTFSTLIQSGVPILGALEIVGETCGNRIFTNAVRDASESVKQGESLGEPLQKSGVFPPMVTKMISIGEKTGALEQLLEKIAEFYDQQVKTTVDSLTSLIEPLMIGVMGFLVGGMVMAIFLPIFKMVGSLGG